MTGIQGRFAVFFGKVDKRPSGWYWISAQAADKSIKGPFTGPFETKAEAIEHAMQNGAGSTLTIFGCVRVSADGQSLTFRCLGEAKRG
jgi:hypothetical protein